MILSANNFNANQLNLNVLEIFERKQLLQTLLLAVLKFANSKKCSDDGGVKKTNKRGNGRFWKIIDLPVAYLP